MGKVVLHQVLENHSKLLNSYIPGRRSPLDFRERTGKLQVRELLEQSSCSPQS